MENFQIFGSKSSIDYDVLFFVDNISTIQDNHGTIKKLNEQAALFFKENNMPEKKVNSNLGVIENGQLVQVFKGTVDEVNNSLYLTYKHHKQFQENKITSLYDRSECNLKHLKLKRCYRFILSFYSNTAIRSNIKQALKGNFLLRLGTLSMIDFNVYREFPSKKEKNEDIYKVIAYQMAQTISLIKGSEIYTKEDVIEQYPDLACYINRELVDNHDVLNKYLQELLEIGRENVDLMADLNEELFNKV